MSYYGKKGYSCRQGAILASASILLFINSCLFCAEETRAPEGAGYELFPIEHISVERCKKCLDKVLAGTITHFPGSPTLLVAARPGELSKAETLLDLVDGPDRFIVRAIRPIPMDRNSLSSRQIAARLSLRLSRGISVGSFSNPPPADANVKAIVDIHNDSVVAVAPVCAIERVVSAIRRLTDPHKPSKSDMTEARDLTQVPTTLTVSKLATPNEAKFLLAGDNGRKAKPNVSPTSSEYRAPKLGAANQSYEPRSLANGEQIVDLALGQYESLTIIEFLGLVGPYLQLDFLYTERDVNQRIAINPHGKFAGRIKVKDLYHLLESVLKLKNLAMTCSRGNLVTITPVGNVLGIDPALLEAGESEIKHGDGVIQRVFRLDHTDTGTAERLLTSMKLATSITAIRETKTLIVTGYAYRMPRIQALLEIVDRPGKSKDFRSRPLRYAMAGTLAPKLQALVERLGTVPIAITAQRTTPPTSLARPQRRRGESSTAYSARVRQWIRARQRRTTTTRQHATAQQPEPTRPTTYIEADETRNRILMIGLDEQLDEIEELIDTLDVAQQDLRTLELYKIEHVNAEEVKIKLEELGIITPRLTTSPYLSHLTGAKHSTTTRGTTVTRRTRTTPRTQLHRETDEDPGEEPQVVLVEQINSLLVNATPEQHKRVVRILGYVDSEMLDSDIPVQLYPLENQSPEHLAEVLEKLIQETTADKEGKIDNAVQIQDEDIIIVPDPNTLSLIVHASKENQEWISNIIENLDKRRPQVLIDVTLVQISKRDAFDYDLNILSSFPDLTETAGMAGALMGGAEGANLVSALLNSDRDHFIDFQSQGGDGTSFYGDKHINALLTAMQQEDYGRVLAKPRILVNDNEPGMIKTADATYVTKAGSTVVGGVQSAVQTSTEFEEYEAGITLEIIPHISSGDLLRLDIFLNRSDFGTITEEKPPDLQSSDIDTTVTIPDGSTIILGGLIKLNQSKGGTKVPILGDLPLLGGLFSGKSNSDIQRNLYVFVKAEIIRPTDTELARSARSPVGPSSEKKTVSEENTVGSKISNSLNIKEPDTLQICHSSCVHYEAAV